MKSYVKYILGGMALLLIGWIAGFEWGVKVGQGVAHLSDNGQLIVISDYLLDQDIDDSEEYRHAVGAAYGMVKRARMQTTFGPNATKHMQNLEQRLAQK